jgi:hypothetical protein
MDWRFQWRTVKASAMARLGKPLLFAYLTMTVFAIVGIVVSLIAMRM